MVTWSETEFTHEGSMTRFDKAQDSLTTFMNCPILFDSSRGEITLGVSSTQWKDDVDTSEESVAW